MAGKQLDLVDQIRACRHCAAALPHEPRPVLRVAAGARVVVIGQAPGAKVHASGVPWQDDSGDHLRAWLAVDEVTFADPDRFAIVPMGFCWPGRRAGGDLPPRPECAPLWHDRVLAELPSARLVLLVGQYAIERYLGPRRKATLGATVKAFAGYGPRHFPLPHPSWRSRLWMQKNPWFERDVLPALRLAVAGALASRPGRRSTIGHG